MLIVTHSMPYPDLDSPVLHDISSDYCTISEPVAGRRRQKRVNLVAGHHTES